MSRMKTIFAGLLVTAIVGIVPAAQAATVYNVKLVIAGSSAMWQTIALGTFNTNMSNSQIGSVAPLHHWTSASNKIALVDNRPSVTQTDKGTLWVVWDSHKNTAGVLNPNVWVYLKVDSVVGVRCFMAVPRCIVNG